MKVLILANSGMGLFKFRKELISSLINWGYEVYVSIPEDSYLDDIELLGCTVITTEINRRGINIIEDVKLLKQYYKLVYKFNPNVILSYTIKPNIYGGMVSRFTKVPIIINITGLGTVFKQRNVLTKIVVYLYKISIKNASTIFFQNIENLQIFMKLGLVKKHTEILPGSGVNLDEYSVLPYPKETEVEFAYVSRIMKEKGIELYLQMAEIIKDKYPNTIFHICGFCEEKYEDLIIQYEKKGIVQYHGLIDNIQDILITTDCLIHPTYYPEGMSNVLLESAASGRPVITSNMHGCKEIVVDDITGFLFKQNDLDDLIKKVEKFLALTIDERKKMGLLSREYVEQKFDRDKVILAYKSAIERACNEL